jgi:DNA adenine methylase
MAKLRTFIKWQGNKSKHISKFEKYLPDSLYSDSWKGTYIEPFVGSGALLLNIQPNKWIINDLNKDLVKIYKYIKSNPEEIITFYKNFGKTFKKLSKKNKIEKCKKLLLKMEKMNYTFDRAKLYMLLKDIAYMGNIIVKNRFYFPNLDLNITVNNSYPFLKEQKFNNIRNVSDFLNETKGKILNKDYKQVLKLAKKGDFVFLDPPYLENLNYQFNYNKNEVIDTHFIETLQKEVKKLDKKGVKWMMTQANTPFIRSIFKKYIIKTFKVYRITKKGYTNEAIIMNYS